MAERSVDVSVIVAARNGAATMRQCIDSVLEQTGCTVELIIVDAMSDDGTKEIVESYGDRVAVYIREPDRGIYDAWNKALEVTRGEWCAFLGADDYFLAEGSLAALLRTAREPGPVPAFVYGGILRVGGAEDYVNHPDPANPREYLRSGRMLPHPGSLHRDDALREIGGFDSSYRIVGDFVAVLELASREGVRRSPELVTAMGIGGISSSWPTSSLSAREKFRALRTAVGLPAAIRRHIGHRWPQVVGRVIEQTVLTISGPLRGTRLLIDLRRRLGRPTKLI